MKFFIYGYILSFSYFEKCKVQLEIYSGEGFVGQGFYFADWKNIYIHNSTPHTLSHEVTYFLF